MKERRSARKGLNATSGARFAVPPFSQKVKDQAYKSLVRPRLEYGCTVWDPYGVYQKSWLEEVQRRATRFVTRTYTREK